VAPQDLQNCSRNFAKHKQSDADFTPNTTHLVAIEIEIINSTLSRLTLDPAGVHCPAWDDAFGF